MYCVHMALFVISGARGKTDCGARTLFFTFHGVLCRRAGCVVKDLGGGVLSVALDEQPARCCVPCTAPQAAREGTRAVAARSLSNWGNTPPFAKWAVFRLGLAGKAC